MLLPVWRAEFAVSYATLALMRGLYSGTMATLQVPAARLARKFGSRSILALGTALAALGYALAGLSGGIVGLCAALALAGAGSSVQHPIASSAVASAYGGNARGPLGTYNFTGDLGKATIPALASFGSIVAVQRHQSRELMHAEFAFQKVDLQLRAAAPELPVEVASGARVPCLILQATRVANRVGVDLITGSAQRLFNQAVRSLRSKAVLGATAGCLGSGRV